MKTIYLDTYKIIFSNDYKYYTIEKNIPKNNIKEFWIEISPISLTELEHQLLKRLGQQLLKEV